jgi:hypothetical protein
MISYLIFLAGIKETYQVYFNSEYSHNYFSTVHLNIRIGTVNTRAQNKVHYWNFNSKYLCKW